MAVSVSITNKRRNHQLVTATIGAVTTWQVVTLPSWVARAEIINFGADAMFLSTDVVDGATGTGGVELASGGSYSFPCGGPDGAFIAVRHASGSYTFAVAMADGEGA